MAIGRNGCCVVLCCVGLESLSLSELGAASKRRGFGCEWNPTVHHYYTLQFGSNLAFFLIHFYS